MCMCVYIYKDCKLLPFLSRARPSLSEKIEKKTVSQFEILWDSTIQSPGDPGKTGSSSYPLPSSPRRASVGPGTI